MCLRRFKRASLFARKELGCIPANIARVACFNTPPNDTVSPSSKQITSPPEVPKPVYGPTNVFPIQ